MQQITEGAPADVFASADTANMDKLTDAGLNGSEPVIFATNLLTIIVAPGNPLGITGVADLANPDIKTVICAPEVPCGNYANQIFTAAGVTVTPVSLEQNVRGVVTKVTAGEADAGIVYVTDVIAAGDAADMVEIPEDINVVAEYPIATVAASENQEVGEAFIDFLTRPRRPGHHGRARLRGAVSVAAPDPPVAVRHRRVGQERLPVPALVLAGIAIAFFALPFLGLLWKAPWGDAWSILTSDSALTALRLSLWCSLWATLAALLFGVPLAWLLARVSFPGPRPGARPVHPVDGAAAGRRRRGAVLLARAARSARPVPRSLVRVHAAVHDRRRRRRPDLRRHAVPRHHRRSRLPPARHPLRGRRPHARRRHAGTCSAASRCRPSAPASIAGAVLAWARALGEFGATITFAGNFPGRTQTMPLAIYLTNEIDPDEAIVLSLVLIAVSFGVLVALRDRFLGGGRPPTA